MRLVPAGFGCGGDDAVGADPRAGAEGAAGDVVEVRRVAERGTLVQVARVRPEVRVVDEPFPRETTERHRHEIEAHELHVEEQVGVGDGVTGEEAPIGEAPVEVVEAAYTRSLTAS